MGFFYCPGRLADQQSLRFQSGQLLRFFRWTTRRQLRLILRLESRRIQIIHGAHKGFDVRAVQHVQDQNESKEIPSRLSTPKSYSEWVFQLWSCGQRSEQGATAYALR